MSNDKKLFNTNIDLYDRLICLAAIITKYCPDNTAVISAQSLYELPYINTISCAHDPETGLVTIKWEEGSEDEPESSDTSAQAGGE